MGACLRRQAGNWHHCPLPLISSSGVWPVEKPAPQFPYREAFDNLKLSRVHGGYGAMLEKSGRSANAPIVATMQAWQSSPMSMWRQIFARLRRGWVGHTSFRHRIPDNLSDEVPLDEIQKVTFFKRDELTADLICCDIEGRERGWFFHEEAEGWDNLLRHLERLPNFQRDWYQEVVQPRFATCKTVAFSKS